VNDEIMGLALEMLREQNRVLKDQVAHLEETIADLCNEESIIKRNYVLLAKARQEERERCAKVAENTPTVLCQNGEFFSERIAKAIRALKDCND
jgi:cell division septum initiation protein DivIVA